VLNEDVSKNIQSKIVYCPFCGCYEDLEVIVDDGIEYQDWE
jgi:hypothetical protein